MEGVTKIERTEKQRQEWQAIAKSQRLRDQPLFSLGGLSPWFLSLCILVLYNICCLCLKDFFLKKLTRQLHFPPMNDDFCGFWETVRIHNFVFAHNIKLRNLMDHSNLWKSFSKFLKKSLIKFSWKPLINLLGNPV